MNKDLNKDVMYWFYVDLNRPNDIISSDKAGLTITVNDAKPNLKFSTPLQELSFNKILGKELYIERFNLNQVTIRTNGHVHLLLKELNLNFKDINYTLKIKGKEVNLDEAYALLQEKNVYQLLEKFLTSKTKSDHYFSFGQTGIMKYFCQNEEKIKQFEELFVNDQFSLPDDEVECEKILAFADLEEPGSALFLKENIPTKSERLEKNKKSTKKLKT